MTAPAASPAPPPARLGRASAILASGTIVSRVLGFASAFVMSVVIGLANQGVNAFAVANTLPNNILPLVSGGLLSATLVPAIVRAAKHDDGGGLFVSRLVTLGTVAFAAVTLVTVALTPVLVAIYTAGGSGNALAHGGVQLTLAMSFWCVPQLFFYALFALLGEVLNARGVFGPVTWVPALNNVVVIASLVLFAVLFGTDGDRPASDWTPAEIAVLAGGATLGVAVQAIGLLFFWRRTGLRFRPDFRWRGVGLGHVGRAGAWTFGMVLVSLVAGIVQTNIALTAGEGDASTNILKYAWLIYVLPHSIIALSIATAYYSRMSAHARDGRLADMRADVSEALRRIALLVGGSAVALAAAAVPFARFFASDDRELDGLALVLLAYLPGLVPYGILYVLQRAFFALGDMRTPFVIQVVQGVLFAGGAFLLLLAPGPWVAAGIAGVTTVAGLVQTVLSGIVLSRRMGGIDGRRLTQRLGVFALATIPSAAAGLGVLALLGGLNRLTGWDLAGGFAVQGRGTAFVSIAIVGGLTALVYLGVVALARVPEVRDLTAPVRRILRRR
jgi:putative peptidoglycan lipid II flippase